MHLPFIIRQNWLYTILQFIILPPETSDVMFGMKVKVVWAPTSFPHDWLTTSDCEWVTSTTSLSTVIGATTKTEMPSWRVQWAWHHSCEEIPHLGWRWIQSMALLSDRSKTHWFTSQWITWTSCLKLDASPSPLLSSSSSTSCKSSTLWRLSLP